MTPLPTTYRKYGYNFELLKRVGNVAIFNQIDDGKVIAFEVFEVLQKEETTATFAGVDITYPAKEAIPSTEMWGKTAYTCSTLERANERFDQITANLSLKQAKATTIEKSNLWW